MPDATSIISKYNEHSWLHELVIKYDRLDETNIDQGNEVILEAISKIDKILKRKSR